MQGIQEYSNMFSHQALTSEVGKLQKFALRLTHNKPDAHDLTQATCLRALEKSDYFADGTNLFGWTSKIMFNLFASQYRRRIRFDSQFDAASLIDRYVVAPTQETNLALTRLQRAILCLRDDHRNILMMICVNGMQYQEVARVLNIPIGTIRSRLARARAQLRLKMSETPANVNISSKKKRTKP
jgi:RNA polymerase sigma-70 factor, ECF subfamily